jgi:heme-degrading monooxygenase HmoA
MENPMEDTSDAYTLAMWRVKEGKEEEFVEAWKNDLGDYFLRLPNPPGTGTLIRSVEDPQLFYSFGPWRSLEDIQKMRSDPRTKEVIGKLATLCEEAKPGTFRVVATAP